MIISLNELSNINLADLKTQKFKKLKISNKTHKPLTAYAMFSFLKFENGIH